MRPEGVRQSLVEEPDSPKDIRMNDGGSIVVRHREQWLAGSEYLIVLDRKGYAHHIAYRNITSIRFLKRNGRTASQGK